MKVLTTEEMRRIERETDAAGTTYAMMMEHAGRAVAEAVCKRMNTAGKRVLVLVGPGNNGGDGLVAARHLHDAGAAVTLYLWKRKTEDDENFRLTQEREIPALDAGQDERLAALRQHLAGADVVIDALLGTGVDRPITGLLKKLLEVTREGLSSRRATAQPPLFVAVDVPTGLNCDTGAVDPVTPTADVTVTFGYPKRGQYLFPGAAHVGHLVVADIGVPPGLADDVAVELATPQRVRALLPPRPLSAHKGTFGKALIVAGSVNYTGAAYLASTAAARVGAGLVTLALAPSIHPILAAKTTEVTFLLLTEDLGVLAPDGVRLLTKNLPGYDALLLGPGLTQEESAIEFVHELLGVRARTARARIGFVSTPEDRPALQLPSLVVDADGLNALARATEWWKALPQETILTPHPGEMARLLGSTVKDVEADRIGVAQRSAQEWGHVVVLKGAYTVIAAPDGRTVINPFANPGLASGGTGDVLSGAIVGFLAQGLAPFDAAVVGAYLHGLAGDMARQEMGDAGMVAGDLLPLLPGAIKRLKAHVATRRSRGGTGGAVLTIPRPPRRRLLGHEVVHYPESDGKPMAENDPQYRCITHTRFALEQYYREDPQVYVGADLLMYYEKGDATKSVTPDVLVALGVPKGNRRNYLIWEEGKSPDVVFEFASPGTWEADVGWKFGLYQGLGVKEYFLFDPLAEHLDPPLQGYRLVRRHYEPIATLPSERGIMGVASDVLGLELWMQPDGGVGMPYVLRLYNPATDTWLLTPEEEAEARQEAEVRAAEAEARAAQAEARAVEEAKARREAEARAAELQAELERLRARLSQE